MNCRAVFPSARSPGHLGCRRGPHPIVEATFADPRAPDAIFNFDSLQARTYLTWVQLREAEICLVGKGSFSVATRIRVQRNVE